MSMYLLETGKLVDRLGDFLVRMEEKFDRDPVPFNDLEHDIDEAEERIKELLELLPSEITIEDWERKIHFLRVYVTKKQADHCRHDLELLIDRLSRLDKKLSAWAFESGYYDDALREVVGRHLRARDFTSAIRSAFVLLTDRMRKKAGPGHENDDGQKLVNKLFGKGSIPSEMSDEERQSRRDYLAGAYGLLRNKYAHNEPQRDIAELEAALATVNLALRLIA